MTLRLYLDEDSSDLDLLKALRMRAIDVISAMESEVVGVPSSPAGLPGTPRKPARMSEFPRRILVKLDALQNGLETGLTG